MHRSAQAGAAVPRAEATRGVQARRERPLRSVLLMMVLAPFVPLFVLCAIAIWYQWRLESEVVHESVNDVATAIAFAVDREIERSKAILDTLAASELIDAKDWRRFHRLALQAIAREPSAFIALTEPSGSQPVRTLAPYDALPVNPYTHAHANTEIEWNGQRLPLTTQGLAKRVFETGRMANSALYYGISVRKPAVSIAVPVMRDGRVAYVLIKGFTVDRLARLLQHAGNPQYQVSLIDANGRIIARTRHPDKSVGLPAPASVDARQNARGGEVLEGPDLDGEPTVFALRRMDLVDWTVNAGVAKSVALTRATRSVLIWCAVGALFLAIGYYAAKRLWRDLAPPLVALGRSARAIQRGETPALPHSTVAEINALGELLREAAATEQREREAAARRYAAEESERVTRAFMEALAESESRFRTFFEHSGVGIGAVDLSTGRFVLVNRRLCEITGYSEPELLERTFSDITHPDDREASGAAMGEIAAGARGAYDAEKRYVRSDGAVRWVEVHVQRFHAAPDTRAMTFASIIDITARKEAELALIAADRRKDEFLATLAHELRNPLAPLRNGLEILKLHPDASPVIGPVRALMERQVKHMVRLIDDLLDVSRITTGRLQLQKAPVDIADVLHAAAEACRPAADAAGHRLRVEVHGAPVIVDGDTTRLVQAVENLVTNAIKYSDEPGEITLRCGADRYKVTITVRDDGIGIPPEKLHLIFDMFSQVHGHRGSSKDRGLGIGLHLVKRLVELHGGTVQAHSLGEGTGSEFRIELPLSDRVPEASARALRILVVDDNRDAARSMATLLAASGHDVKTAFDGPHALRTIEEWTPELLFLDIGMPDMDGYEVVRRLRSAPHLPQPFIAAVSGWGQPQDRRRTAEAGFDRHLVKPVEMRDVLEVIAEVADRGPRLAEAAGDA